MTSPLDRIAYELANWPRWLIRAVPILFGLWFWYLMGREDVFDRRLFANPAFERPAAERPYRVEVKGHDYFISQADEDWRERNQEMLFFTVCAVALLLGYGAWSEAHKRRKAK